METETEMEAETQIDRAKETCVHENQPLFQSTNKTRITGCMHQRRHLRVKETIFCKRDL